MIVKLNYFKLTGKWYSEGEFEWQGPDNAPLYQIWEAVRHMNPHPGLMNAWSGIILVDVPEHQHNHFGLLVPEEVRKLYK